jgi:hypothetical protein
MAPTATVHGAAEVVGDAGDQVGEVGAERKVVDER